MAKAKDVPCRNGRGCADKNLTKYHASGGCGTPYCGGWSEYHCRRCGWYSCSCPCGSCNGWSKVSSRAQRTAQRKAARRVYHPPETETVTAEELNTRIRDTLDAVQKTIEVGMVEGRGQKLSRTDYHGLYEAIERMVDASKTV